MDSIKTAIVLVFLLAIMYGAYVVLNKPVGDPPAELAGWNSEQLEPPEIDFEQPEDSRFTAPDIPQDPTAPAADASVSEATANGPAPPTGEAPPLLDAPGDVAGDPTATNDQEVAAEDTAIAADSAAGERSIYESNPTDSGDVALPQMSPGPPPGGDASQLADSGQGWEPLEPEADAAPAPTDEQTVASENAAPDVPSVDLPPRKPADEVADAGDAPAPANASQAGSLEEAMATAAALIRDGKPRDALAELSPWHFQELSPAQREQLYGYLDPLAGRVVYSRLHLMTDPHVVRDGENLFTIAEQYRVPWELLRNINGLRSPRALPPQTELKVVPGPFSGFVDLSDAELTLYVDDLYAGRFALQVGADPAPVAGRYKIEAKQEGHTYFAADGSSIPAGDPQNPYGAVWMDLGQGFCLHGGGGEPAATNGCLALRTRDANDVYGILSLGSKIVVSP